MLHRSISTLFHGSGSTFPLHHNASQSEGISTDCLHSCQIPAPSSAARLPRTRTFPSNPCKNAVSAFLSRIHRTSPAPKSFPGYRVSGTKTGLPGRSVSPSGISCSRNAVSVRKQTCTSADFPWYVSTVICRPSLLCRKGDRF